MAEKSATEHLQELLRFGAKAECFVDLLTYLVADHGGRTEIDAAMFLTGLCRKRDEFCRYWVSHSSEFQGRRHFYRTRWAEALYGEYVLRKKDFRYFDAMTAVIASPHVHPLADYFNAVGKTVLSSFLHGVSAPTVCRKHSASNREAYSRELETNRAEFVAFFAANAPALVSAQADIDGAKSRMREEARRAEEDAEEARQLAAGPDPRSQTWIDDLMPHLRKARDQYLHRLQNKEVVPFHPIYGKVLAEIFAYGQEVFPYDLFDANLHFDHAARAVLSRDGKSLEFTDEENRQATKTLLGYCNQFLDGTLPWISVIDTRTELASGETDHLAILRAFERHLETWQARARTRLR